MSRRRSNVRQYSAEDQALTAISKEAENRLAAKRAARAEAREIRTKEIERKQKEEDEKEKLGSDYAASRARQPAGSRRGSNDSSEGTGDGKDRDMKKELRTLEEKYKAAMMTSAQLDNEKQSLVYQVELLKDQLEEHAETHTELQREYKDKHRDLEMTKRELQAAQLELKALREQNDYKDRLITESGLVIVAAENGELALERSKEAPSANGPVGTGGLLLSSESLTLLNKGREGSLGMHSLDSSSPSATHTTQTASSTSQSQPLSQTHAEEPQPERQAQTSSSVPVTTGEDPEGSSVDGPMPNMQAPENSQISVGSSACLAGDVNKDGSVEAVDALSAQSGAAVSHSPDDRLSQNFLQETDAVAPDKIDAEHVCGEMKGNSNQVTGHETMGIESSVDSTSDGMFITHLHGDESDSCKDKGWKESDYEDSHSDLPSVVVTECSHSQPRKSEDSEEDDVEFFDAVSTPLPSTLDRGFKFEAPGADAGEGAVVQVAGATTGETSTEGLVREISPDSVQAEDVETEDFKEVSGEEEGNKETLGEVDRDEQDEQFKEVSREEEGNKETLGEVDRDVQDEQFKEVSGEEEDHKETLGEVDREVQDEQFKEASGEEEGSKETLGEVDREVQDEQFKEVSGEEEGSKKTFGEVGGELQDEDGKDITAEKVHEEGDGVKEGGSSKEEITDGDSQVLEVEAEGADKNIDGKSDEQVSCTVAGSDSGVPVEGAIEIDTENFTDNDKSDQKPSELDSFETENLTDNDKSDQKPSELDSFDENKHECDTSDTALSQTIADASLGGGAFVTASSDVEIIEKTMKEGDGVSKEGNVGQESECVDVREEGETGTGGFGNEQQDSQVLCVEGHSEETEEVDVKKEGNVEQESVCDSVQMDVCEGHSEKGVDKQDVTGSDETFEVESHAEPAPVSSEVDELQTGSPCEAESDHSVLAGTDATVSEDSSLNKSKTDESRQQLEGGEQSDMKLKETAGEESQTDPTHVEDEDTKDIDENEGTKDTEEGDGTEKGKDPENMGCKIEKEERSEESEEFPDSLSPMLSPRKSLDREHSEGGTSEDSEARLNDDGYDFDDIDAVLDEGSPVSQKGKGSESNPDADLDEKVSFGSKDSGLQESFSTKEYEANKEDTVSFGSGDSGLQESIHKEGEAGFGDTVSVQSGDSGAAAEDTASLVSQDSNAGKPTLRAEEGAVGGPSAHHAVSTSRESLDLEAKLDQMVSGDSVTKEVLPKEKRHKKSKKFRMFKNIFK